MFNLESRISIWKSEFAKRGTLTNDDIDELESHILDTIDELENKGYALEEAFNMAIEKLGTDDLLSEEYEKVNARLSLFQKVTYGIIGFIGLNFIFRITEIIMLMIGSLFADKIMALKPINIPIISNIVRSQVPYYNTNLFVFILIITIILNIVSLGIILSNKKSIISAFIEGVERKKDNKIYYSILLLAIPIMMYLLPNIIEVILINNINCSFDILSIMNFTYIPMNIVILIGFVIEVSKNARDNKYKLTILSGYLGVNVLFMILPRLYILSMEKLLGMGIITTLVTYLAIIIVAAYLFINSKSRKNMKGFSLSSKKRFIIGLVILVALVSCEFIMVKIAVSMDVSLYGEICYVVNLLQVIAIHIIPCACYLSLLIKTKFSNTNKQNA